MKLSYCICAHNEAAELEKLLRFLKGNIREEDEVVIQLDSTYTPEVLEVCNLFTNFNHKEHIESQSIPNSKWYVNIPISSLGSGTGYTGCTTVMANYLNPNQTYTSIDWNNTTNRETSNIFPFPPMRDCDDCQDVFPC